MNRLIMPEQFICGYYDSRKSNTTLQSPKRIATTFEIELITESGLSTFINGNEIEIKKNHIIITKPGDERYSLLHFKTMFIKFHADEKLAEIMNDLPTAFYAIHIERLKEILYDIILLKESSRPDNFLFYSKLLEFLSLVVSDSKNSVINSEQDYKAMHRSKKYIKEHFEEKISNSDIANAVNLSESYFRSLFRSTYGITPHQFLINTRIDAAKQMLWHSDKSISEIAEKCGFSCQQYFNVIFKKETGFTPREYRIQFAKRYNS